jgi:hypothetical protein
MRSPISKARGRCFSCSPGSAQSYRLAHEIAERNDNEDVGMEKLREAMLHYQALFANLPHE